MLYYFYNCCRLNQYHHYFCCYYGVVCVLLSVLLRQLPPPCINHHQQQHQQQQYYYDSSSSSKCWCPLLDAYMIRSPINIPSKSVVVTVDHSVGRRRQQPHNHHGYSRLLVSPSSLSLMHLNGFRNEHGSSSDGFIPDSNNSIDHDGATKSSSTSRPLQPQVGRRRILQPQRPIRRNRSSNNNDNSYSNDDYTTSTTSNINNGISNIYSKQQLERMEQQERAQERYVEALKDPTLFVQRNSSSSSNSNNNNIRSNFYFDDNAMAPSEKMMMISAETKRAIQEILGLRQMTEIQHQTYPIAMQGKSILGRARTGTGKTVAYLLPAIERLLKMDPTVFRPGRTIGIIIIAPTRELVLQLSQEATKLLTFHASKGYTVQPLYGGISIQRDRAILLHRPIPTILISTPGRLYDILRDTAPFRVQYGNRLFTDVIHECPIVIFDEADQLVEGFVREINSISSYLQRIDKRQTMLFSATISSKLKQVLSSSLQSNGRQHHQRHAKMLPNDYKLVDCINDMDIKTYTNQRVSQSFIQLLDMKLYVPAFLSLVENLMNNNSDDSHNPPTTATKKKCIKVILFLPTAKLVKFFTEVLHHIQSSSLSSLSTPYEVYSIHSRMSQGSRNRASSQFRTNTANCILLSSDVSARGVDYPDVTFVVQYGAPYNDELYLHRLGRTGRAGQAGNGLLVLLPFETRFRSKCRTYNITENIDRFKHINEPSFEISTQLDTVQNCVRGGNVVLTPCAEAACVSFIAHYIEYGRDNKRSGKSIVLDAARELANSFGLTSVPDLPENVQTKIKTKRS